MRDANFSCWREAVICVRDLAMFNTAIDSKLRGCDPVKLRVADVHLGDSVRLRTTVANKRPVGPFPSSLPTRPVKRSRRG